MSSTLGLEQDCGQSSLVSFKHRQSKFEPLYLFAVLRACNLKRKLTNFSIRPAEEHPSAIVIGTDLSPIQPDL